MGNIKQINIKNRTYYVFNDMINIEDFDSNLLKIDKKSYKNIDISYIGYITMKDFDYVKINTVNTFYLIIGEADRYIEEKNGNKYLNFASTDKNKEVLKKHTELWNEVKYQIKTINGGKAIEYEKDFMKIKINSDDNLALNKILKLNMLAVIIRSVFQENGKYYPQDFLDECLYELKILEYDRIDVSEGIDINKTNASKKCDICHYCYFSGKGFKYDAKSYKL